MDNKKYEELINILINSIENFIPIEYLREQLNPNFLDNNFNNYFHYLSKYSFKNFCSNNNLSKDIINKTAYNNLLNQYLEKIIAFTNILIGIDCDINQKNIYDQTPLDFCIIKQNYYLAKEYLNYYFIDFENNNDILNLIFNDICLRDECIDFVISLFKKENNTLSKEAMKNYLNKKINNKNNSETTPFISIFENYYINIYKKYIQLIKTNCIEYLQKGNKGEYIIQSDKKIINTILEKSLIEFNDFCLTKFFNLITSLLELKVDFNFIENYSKNKDISAFMYLMAYPFIPDINSFIIQQNININYQDYLGRTPLIHLINNKKNINKICTNIYEETFNSLINNSKIDISLRDENGISPFLLCLINDYSDDAKEIYYKHLKKYQQEFNLDIILLFIIKIYSNKFNNDFISKIQKILKNEFNFDSIDSINGRSLLHYFFMSLSDINKDYINTINILMNIITEKNKKDIFNRNCLFYLFIDFCGDPKKNKDRFEILDYCLKQKLFNISINEKDIFGKNLLFYATECGFINSVKILISNGATFDEYLEDNENNIYINALISNEKLFFYFYDIKKVNLDLYKKINIFQSNYYSFIENKDDIKYEKNNKFESYNSNQILNMYDFFHEPELIIQEGYYPDNKEIEYPNKINKEDIKNEYIEENQESEFTAFNLLNEGQKHAINKFIQNNLNLNFENQSKTFSLNFCDKNLKDIKLIIENPEYFIQIIKVNKKIIFSDSIIKYAISHDKKGIIEKLKLDMNKIDICKLYLELNKKENLINFLNNIADEKADILVKLKNKENQTIFHVLSLLIENDEKLNMIYNKLKSIKINNLFDANGNTPMYYACKIMNKKFIEIFSNYIISNKFNKKVDTKLFIETHNNKTPLEELYKKINLLNNNLLNLIIEITLKEKKGYIKYIVDYLINNYKSSNKILLSKSYKNNLSNSNNLTNIIGIYQYLKNELKSDLNYEDENGNDPFMKSILKNNISFFNDILLPLKQKEYFLNRVNKERKSLIHLIVESKIKNKKEMLLALLNQGFNFNIKDKNELLPIDYAYMNHNKEIFDIFKNNYYKEGLPLKIILLNNFYKDSDSLFKESISISSKYQQCDDLFGLVIDKYKTFGDNIYQVCVDNEYIPYNINLLRGNIDYSNCALKYQLQIIENIKTKKYIVVFSNEEFQYNDFQEAKNKFKEIFKTKTNNNWDDVKKDRTQFKTNIIKYHYFDYNFEQELNIYQYLKITINNLNIKKEIKYDGNYKVRDLIYYLARKAYNNRFNNEKNTKEIIINYKEQGIKNTSCILNEIIGMIDKGKIDDSNKRKKAYLLNCYFQLIPFSIHNDDNNLFNSIQEIYEEKGRITTYYYIENVLKIFLGAIKNLDEMHPLDYIINSLGCNIIELDENSLEKKYIKDFLINTGANSYSIKNIFKITESRNDIFFNPYNFDKRYIFFHGTKPENILGILSEGLKISPVQAKFSGKRFGDGIYLSDSYEISIVYSKKDKDKKDKKYILLVEAALGEKNKDYITHDCEIEKEHTFITEEGYRILKIPCNSKRNGIIVVKNAMNVRVKYIIEV